MPDYCPGRWKTEVNRNQRTATILNRFIQIQEELKSQIRGDIEELTVR